MSKQNIVVSGRYFSGIWKCFAYPWFLIIGAILSLFVIPPLGGLLYVLGIFGFFAGKIGTTFYLHADAVNLKEAHGVKKGVWPYIIAFWFFGYLVVVIYHSSRSALIRRAGLVEESIEGRRIWSYHKQKEQINLGHAAAESGSMYKCDLCSATFSQSKGADGCPECYSSDISEV